MLQQQAVEILGSTEYSTLVSFIQHIQDVYYNGQYSLLVFTDQYSLSVFTEFISDANILNHSVTSEEVQTLEIANNTRALVICGLMVYGTSINGLMKHLEQRVAEIKIEVYIQSKNVLLLLPRFRQLTTCYRMLDRASWLEIVFRYSMIKSMDSANSLTISDLNTIANLAYERERRAYEMLHSGAVFTEMALCKPLGVQLGTHQGGLDIGTAQQLGLIEIYSSYIVPTAQALNILPIRYQVFIPTLIEIADKWNNNMADIQIDLARFTRAYTTDSITANQLYNSLWEFLVLTHQSGLDIRDWRFSLSSLSDRMNNWLEQRKALRIYRNT